MTRVPRSRIAAMNRTAWNGIAEAWGRRQEVRDGFRSLRRSRLGTLWPEEIRLLGPVRGKTLLHLQCGAGEDTLSWAKRGARATGLDVAERRLAQGRAWAARLGLRATFVAGDVMRLPFPRSSFDLVYTSRGAVVWIPQVRGWAREVARVLKPGGRFLLCDEHPFLYTLIQHGRETPRVGWNYFDQHPHVWRGWWFLRDAGPQTAKVETDWTLSSVFNALAEAGLRLTSLRESPDVTALDFRMPPARRRWLPRTLISLWAKP